MPGKAIDNPMEQTDLDAPDPLMEITRDASWEPPLKIMMDLLFIAGSTKTIP